MTLCKIKIKGLALAEQNAREILEYCESIRALQKAMPYSNILIETDLVDAEAEEGEEQ